MKIPTVSDNSSRSDSSRLAAPRVLAAWISLCTLAVLAALGGTRAVAWGALPAARLTMIGSLLATAVALWLWVLFTKKNLSPIQSQNGTTTSPAPWVSTAPWSLFSAGVMALLAALVLRMMSEFSGLHLGAGALPAPRLVFSNVLLVASSLALAVGVGLWTLPHSQNLQTQRRGTFALWLADGFIGGGALVAAGWWLWRVPMMLKPLPVVAPASGSGIYGLCALWGVCAALMLTLAKAVDVWGTKGAVSSVRKDQLRALRISWISVLLLLCALFFWVWADIRFLNVGTRGAISTQDVLLRWLAPLLMGASMLLRPAVPEATVVTFDDQSNVSSAGDAEPGHEFILGSSRLWRDLWIILLPCAVVLSSAWRLGDGDLRAKVLGAEVGALWWGPLLLLLAVVRHIVSLRIGAQSWIEVSRLRMRLQQATATLHQRTRQISTLHSATADLSDLRNCEHILTTAIERTLSALNAQCGAVWLYVDREELGFTEMSVSEGNSSHSATSVTLPIETFVWRELERSGNERRALASLHAGFNERNSNLIRGTQNGAMEVHDKQWSMVVARGHQSAQGRYALKALHSALASNTDLQRFTQLAQSDNTEKIQTAISETNRSINVMSRKAGAITVEDSTHVQRSGQAAENSNTDSASTLDIWQQGHIAEIRSKGRVLGAIGIARAGAPLDKSERAMVSALAFEAGSALQNVQLYQEMSRLVDRDSLTDLYNHRAIQGQLNSLLSRAQRSEAPLAVIMMDLNNFKFFNDTYGHSEGDRVLRIVARCLVEVCRMGDVVGRFGGDEFIALLVDTDEEGALQSCRRIAARIEEEGYQQPGEKRRIPITLSFGLASYAQDGNSALELLSAADASLQETKRGGSSMPTRRDNDQNARELRKLKEAGTGGSFGVLDALVTAIDNKDHYTRQHSEDVTKWASLMARQLEYSSETLRAVRIAGLLHDVGKIAVPDAVLRKPGRLNDDEFNIMQQHPVFGALIVKDVPNLPEVLGGIRHHHERFDGKGYPDKLRGEAIPLLGRLLAVPDCFSAMTTDRPYRKALTWSEAFSEIEKGKGTQFDPTMADAFLEVMARIVGGENLDEGDAIDLDNDEFDDAAANQVARSMAESEPVSTPDADNSQFRPRSVADAENK